MPDEAGNGAATPPPTPTAAPSAASDRTYVSGTMVCHITGAGEPTATGEYQPNPLYIDCTYAMSDPRVTGTDHGKLSATFVGLEAVNGTSSFWVSSNTLMCQGGTWQGSGFGSEFVSEPIEPMTLYTSGTVLYEGQGAFTGLSCRVLWAREVLMSGVPVPYVVSRWIEPTK